MKRSKLLMVCYDELTPRLEQDLNDEREVLLSKGGELMLMQELSNKMGEG